MNNRKIKLKKKLSRKEASDSVLKICRSRRKSQW